MWVVLVEGPPQSVVRLLVVLTGGHVADSDIDADLTMTALADVASGGDDDGVDYSPGSVVRRRSGDVADIERQRSSCAPLRRQTLHVALAGADQLMHLWRSYLRSMLDVGGDGVNGAGAAGVAVVGGGNKSRKWPDFQTQRRRQLLVQQWPLLQPPSSYQLVSCCYCCC